MSSIPPQQVHQNHQNHHRQRVLKESTPSSNSTTTHIATHIATNHTTTSTNASSTLSTSTAAAAIVPALPLHRLTTMSMIPTKPTISNNNSNNNSNSGGSNNSSNSGGGQHRYTHHASISSSNTSTILTSVTARGSLPSISHSNHSGASLSASYDQSLTPITSSAASSVDQLRLRIRDVEKENERLRLHVQQAEESIRSYRGFLSTKTEITTRSSKRDVSIQTEDVSLLVGNKIKELEDKNFSLEINRHSLMSTIETLTNELKRKEELDQRVASRSDDYERTIAELKKKVDQFSQQSQVVTPSIQASISSITTALPTSSSSSTPVVMPQPKVTSTISKSLFKEGMRKQTQIIAKLRSELAKEKIAVRAAIKVCYDFVMTSIRDLQLNIASSASVTKGLQAQCEQLSRVNLELKSELVATQNLQKASELEAATTIAKFSRLDAELELLKQQSVAQAARQVNTFLTKHASSNTSPAKSTVTSTQGCDPVTPQQSPAPVRSHTPQSTKRAREREHSLQQSLNQAEAQILALKSSHEQQLQALKAYHAQQIQQIQQQHNHQLQQSQQQSNQQLLQLNQQKNEIETSREYFRNSATDSQHKLAAKDVIISQLKNHLTALKMKVGALPDAHALSLKSAQHHAHCKDLSRIAAQRELTIERDCLLEDVKRAKEAMNILTFSLGTAEQSLAEVNPQVVAKLQEGRQKRMKRLEQGAVDGKKAIEQRSAETCAVSTAHLEEFQTKAAKKLEYAQREWTQFLAEINELMDTCQQAAQ